MQALDIVFNIVVLFCSVIMHELSHGYVALWLGDPTAKFSGRLTLNPLKHLDPIGSLILPLLLFSMRLPVFGWAKPVPYNPYNLRKGVWGPALVAMAGPLSNLACAIFFTLCLHVVAWSGIITLTLVKLFATIIAINVFLFVFNSVPLPPLDGSKVLSAVLPARYQWVMQFLERYQLLFLFLFVFFGWSLLIPIPQFITELLLRTL